jgi:hypothetical protein
MRKTLLGGVDDLIANGVFFGHLLFPTQARFFL